MCIRDRSPVGPSHPHRHRRTDAHRHTEAEESISILTCKENCKLETQPLELHGGARGPRDFLSGKNAGQKCRGQKVGAARRRTGTTGLF
eukprot:6108819-Lingulodinium_polyedra.AAC.1